MSSERPTVTVRDLAEEAKKRVVILGICVVGLSYLMSLTSSSVWVNLPIAASLIIALRYLSMDFDTRRKATIYNSRPTTGNLDVVSNPFEDSKAVLQRPNWRKKVRSPVVEDAIDQFSRHLISEWVTNLWYSKLTPDKEGPEELVQIMNGVMGEFSRCLRNINLIDLLTRDIIHRVCNHLEHFRECQVKIAKTKSEPLTFDQRDMELKITLAAENRLHPVLFSPEAEHKVLQHLMEGLISLTFRPEDLQCSFFRYIVRELLACAVMRPVLNMASPRFINERIEQVVLSVKKGNKGTLSGDDAAQSKQNGSPKVAIDHFSRDPDPSASGVELVQLKSNSPKGLVGKPGAENVNGAFLSKDPLLSMDARSTRSWKSLSSDPLSGNGKDVSGPNLGKEWGDMLDFFSQRKTQALTPENFENMWTKGKKIEDKGDETSKQPPQRHPGRKTEKMDSSNVGFSQEHNDGQTKGNFPNKGSVPSGTIFIPGSDALSTGPSLLSDEEDENESESSSYYSSESEESSITGLDTPTTKVWDGRTIRNVGVSRIRHPLESKHRKLARRSSAEHGRQLPRSRAGRTRSGPLGQDLQIWQEIERTSFLSGDGQDILKPKQNTKDDDSSDEYDLEIMNRVQSNTAASSSTPSIPVGYKLSTQSSQSPFYGNTFFKLRCEVIGANIVKSSSKSFAVYSISVSDADKNSWSIKRRFRHFEELHRRLKEYPEYSLHLPPKHFLSTGLDIPVIQERCVLLDRYLKMLMQLPTISGSIEVWDFLSVDSQTYTFSSTFSIVETLSVDTDDKPQGKSGVMSSLGANKNEPFKSKMESSTSENKMNNSSTADGFKMDAGGKMNSFIKKPGIEYQKHLGGADSNLDNKLHHSVESEDSQQKSGLPDAYNYPTLPTEWVPPNLSAPMLDLVDVIFQLQEGGWIRRKAFWVVKQVLQLGMGDALDDWLIEKIRLLRRGPVIASVIKRVEQILWPDGIFITKHPKRQRPPPPSTPNQSLPGHPDQLTSPKGGGVQKLDDEQQKEADRRAKLVYETMIDNAPAAVVSLVGRKEYEQCAKDLYFFLQSSVCLKQLTMDILELILLSAFPEMDHCFKQLHEEKHRFGEFKPS